MPTPRRLNFEEVGRILNAVAESGLPIPNEYQTPPIKGLGSEPYLQTVRKKRSELSGKIAWAYTLRDSHPDLMQDSRSKAQFETLRRVALQARSLRQLIDLEIVKRCLADHFLPGAVHLVDVSEILHHLESAAISARNEMKSNFYNEQTQDVELRAPLADLGVDLGSPDNIYYRCLGQAFESVYSRPPKIEQDSTRQAMGSFLAFIQAIRKEMGDPEIKPDSIRKAIDRAQLQDKKG